MCRSSIAMLISKAFVRSQTCENKGLDTNTSPVSIKSNPEKPLWGSIGRCPCFDWQAPTLRGSAFPRAGNCRRQPAEATSHPWTAVRQRAKDGENSDLQGRPSSDRPHAYILYMLAHKGGGLCSAPWHIVFFLKACFCWTSNNYWRSSYRNYSVSVSIFHWGLITPFWLM